MEKESIGKRKAKKKGTEEGRLYKEFKSLKPQFQDKESAIASTIEQLEKMAANAGTSVEEYLKVAHTTSNYTSEHATALQLERQLNFLRR